MQIQITNNRSTKLRIDITQKESGEIVFAINEMNPPQGSESIIQAILSAIDADPAFRAIVRGL